MKAAVLTSTGALLLSMMACSTTAAPPADGSGGSGTGGSGASSGGSTGTGGGTGTGGSTGSGGVQGTGGMTSSGGTTGSSGGSSTGGTGTGAGGSTAASTGGAGGAPDLLSVVGAWDGALVLYPCGNNGTGYDCDQPTTANCTIVTGTNNPASVIIPAGQARTPAWTIGGTSGTIYNVTVRISGIVEATSYVGGTRDAGNASILTSRDLFQQGGAAQQNGGPSYDYNSYELQVTPPVAGLPLQATGRTADVYFLNSVTTNENPHFSATAPTVHLTFAIDYTKTIKVPGGGTVTFKVIDSNCRLVMNCGPTSGGTCASPRAQLLPGVVPPLPTSFVQPYQQPAGRYGQWVHFDVTSVTAAQ